MNLYLIFSETSFKNLKSILEQQVPIQRAKVQISKEEKHRREQAMKLKMRIEKAETFEEIALIEEEIRKGKFDDIMNELDEEAKVEE